MELISVYIDQHRPTVHIDDLDIEIDLEKLQITVRSRESRMLCVEQLLYELGIYSAEELPWIDMQPPVYLDEKTTVHIDVMPKYRRRLWEAVNWNSLLNT
ncbi:hypothetical protein [Alicyclobacillus shizuokensis]|uniref:hypothetical protein n=1 Tax=Alicyclobacillus shizuokensis TaxID=392014 RepID=UPI00082ED689|nr:hypothetical protein [Alicyclobacillus shizuokensis]